MTKDEAEQALSEPGLRPDQLAQLLEVEGVDVNVFWRATEARQKEAREELEKGARAGQSSKK